MALGMYNYMRVPTWGCLLCSRDAFMAETKLYFTLRMEVMALFNLLLGRVEMRVLFSICENVFISRPFLRTIKISVLPLVWGTCISYWISTSS